jgi:integrase
VSELDTAFVGAFPNHLETERGNSARTRNTRLAAIRSFFGYVALHEPLHAALAQRVPAMPSKRCTRRPMDLLDRDEVEALPGAPDTCTRSGRRARTLLLVAVQTGLSCRDARLGQGARLRCGPGWKSGAANRTRPSSPTSAAAR